MGKGDYQVFYGKAAGVDAQGFLVTGAGRVLSRGAAILNRQHCRNRKFAGRVSRPSGRPELLCIKSRGPYLC
jgi:hypothetical protein